MRSVSPLVTTYITSFVIVYMSTFENITYRPNMRQPCCRRVYHKKIISTVERYADENAARRAIRGIAFLQPSQKRFILTLVATLAAFSRLIVAWEPPLR